MGPPYPYRSLQLVGRILSLQMLSNPQQTELLLYRVKPLIHLKRFFGLFQDRRLSFLEILERAVLIWLRPLMLLMSVSGVLRNEAQYILHGSLITQELYEEFIRRQ